MITIVALARERSFDLRAASASSAALEIQHTEWRKGNVERAGTAVDGSREGLHAATIAEAAAAGLTRFLSTQLYGVKPTDGLTFAAVALTLSATALAAVLLPARRASSIEPVTALRHE